MPRHLAEADGSKLPWFHKVLWRDLSARGARLRIVQRDEVALAAAPETTDFDFVHQGVLRRPRLLNTAIAYLGSHYYADPMGIYFQSSITAAKFDPAAQPAERAEAFFARLRAEHVTTRVSREPQPRERTDFDPGAISVFLQDWSLPVERARYMDAEAMVRAVLAGAGGRQLIVKPHPKIRGEETLLLLHRLRRNRQVTVTGANLHDILAASVACVSICSSVAVEAMLHRVPAILFGRSDLHHCAETVTRPQDFAAALDRAMTRDYPYAAFLFWFLQRRNLRIGPQMVRDLLPRMQKAGADLAALGIRAD